MATVTDKPDLTLITEALRQGVRVVWDPPRFRGPSSALSLAKEATGTAREILRRAAIFRAQAESFIREGRLLPPLALPGAPNLRDRCLSCGGDLEGNTWRCPVCTLAVRIALDLPPEPPA